MGLKVDTKHAQYRMYEERWIRCRDCAEGGDAVKAKGVLYLPALDTHSDLNAMVSGSVKYAAYLKRALFYNATNRTVDGFSGAVFQKPPTVVVPKKYEESLEDVTLTETSFTMFGLDVLREILTVGRAGILVDMPTSNKLTLDPEIRPYLSYYTAEDIYNWDTARINGREVLTLLVLREVSTVQTDDPFVKGAIESFRVYQLVGGECITSMWLKVDNEWLLSAEATPLTRLGKPLDFIPFQFLGSQSLSPRVARPPLIDLVDLNLSHYRTSADLEHGRHFTALPQPWVSGIPAGSDPLAIGAGGVWCLDKDGEAGMLEFKGEGLGALVTADQEKRKMMATLGARLLEEQGGPAETATAVQMRHAGEQASLKKIVGLLEVGLKHSLQTFCWWGGEGEKPAEVKVEVKLNRDFFALRMSSEDLKALILSLQAGAISHETFWYNIGLGDIARPGVTSKQERDQIDKEKPEPMPNAAIGPDGKPLPPGPDGLTEDGATVKDAGPGIGTGDTVMKDEGPYKLIKRDGKWLVVKADTGKIVPGGDHGHDEKGARKHLAALHANVKE